MTQGKLLSKVLRGLIAWLCLFNGCAFANCWEDSHLFARASQVARQHFPRIHELPAVVVCAAGDFGPSIGGSFTGNPRPLIRIPVWQLGRAELNTVLAHELGHYQSFLDGTDDGSASGHGPGWMAVMLAAGLHDEAQRVAATVPGAGRALAQVHGEAQGGDQRRIPRAPRRPDIEYLPPQYAPPQIVTCFLQPQQTVIRDHRGRQYVTTIYVEVCTIG